MVEHELMAELGDRHDEDEVEEELEPRRPSLVPLVCGSQPRRDQPARPGNGADELDLGSCSPAEVDVYPEQRRHAWNGAQTPPRSHVWHVEAFVGIIVLRGGAVR